MLAIKQSVLVTIDFQSMNIKTLTFLKISSFVFLQSP